MNKKISIQTSLYASLLVGLAFAALSASQFPRASAQSSTPTYVLGVSSPLDPLVVDLQSQTSSLTILSGVSGLSVVGPGSILFIDGAWLQSVSSLDPTILPLLDSTVLNGVPSVVVRGTPTILQNSISGLIKGQVPNLPLIAEGLKIFGTLPSGTQQGAALQVIAGFDYAVSTEFTWAQQHLTNAILSTFAPLSTSMTPTTKTPTTGVLLAPTSSPAGSWTFVLQLTADSGPYFTQAHVISNFTIYGLQNGGSTSTTTTCCKWYNFFANQTLIPNSPWRNFNETDNVKVSSANSIISHGPASQITSGPTTVTYTIGVTKGAFSTITANQTQTYMLKNTNVTDTTQPSQTSQVGWLHSIDPRSSSGKLQFSIVPGWTDQIPTNQGIDLHATFTSTFVQLSGGMITQTAFTAIQFVVAGG